MEGDIKVIKCSQCEKPAIGLVGEHPLYVDCYHKLQQTNQIYSASVYSYMNFLIGEMESAIGVYGATPRIEVPTPIVHQGPVNFHNIRVDKSIIGVINTGERENV